MLLKVNTAQTAAKMPTVMSPIMINSSQILSFLSIWFSILFFLLFLLFPHSLHNLLEQHVILLQNWRQEIRDTISFSSGGNYPVFLEDFKMMPYRSIVHFKRGCQLVGVLRSFL